jgi:hypothetical protein
MPPLGPWSLPLSESVRRLRVRFVCGSGIVPSLDQTPLDELG